MNKRKTVYVVGNNHEVQKLFSDRGWDIMYDAEKNKNNKVPDLLCFTGGSDIDPKLYGEQRIFETQYTHPNRDKGEIEIFQKFISIPKIGICRGAQLCNVLSGGSMWQDVNNHHGNHDIRDLLLNPGEMIEVTSTHHQMMEPGNEGVVLATTHRATNFKSWDKKKNMPKYDSEVVWYWNTNSLCFQPHPEYGKDKKMEPMREYFFKLIEYFLVD